MEATTATLTQWLDQAHIRENALTPEQRGLLQAALHFRQTQGTDYYTTRLLSHFLLHCDSGLKVAQIARLLGLCRTTASRQQGFSSKEALQAAQHRMAGRPYGKLLPRYAGPIAEYVITHPQATRYDTLAFIHQTFGVHVSTVALFKYLRKYGLDQASLQAATAAAQPAEPLPASPACPHVQAAPSPAFAGDSPHPPCHSSQPASLPAPPLFFGQTNHAGAFLLLPQAMSWLATARQCFADDYRTLQRGLLTSVFALVVGLERIFHLDEMIDPGFALLTGGRRCPSRFSVGGWRRHLPWYEVDAFCRRTSPWHLLRGHCARTSYDEHTIPRWTHKFRIGKGYVTTRNKYMRCEKLFYTFDLENKRYLAVRGTPGNWELRDLAVSLTRQTLAWGRPHYLHAFFDAGAGKSDADVRALWNLVTEQPNLNVTLRACRYPHRVRQWKQLPRGVFVCHEEPGVCVGAPCKEIRLAETTTVLKDESAEQAVRTIVCREIVPGPKKDRWHPLYTTSDVDPYDELTLFRVRQHHEQAYRVGVYDEFLDAVPCGYDKASPNRKRPRFQRGPLQMIGWLVALVFNAVADLALVLEGDYAHSQVRTLRRTFFNRPGQLYLTPQALIVSLEPFSGQEALVPLIDALNAAGHRVPWLENRRLVLSLRARGQRTSGP